MRIQSEQILQRGPMNRKRVNVFFGNYCGTGVALLEEGHFPANLTRTNLCDFRFGIGLYEGRAFYQQIDTLGLGPLMKQFCTFLECELFGFIGDQVPVILSQVP